MTHLKAVSRFLLDGLNLNNTFREVIELKRLDHFDPKELDVPLPENFCELTNSYLIIMIEVIDLLSSIVTHE
jgi:hypothetical protein